MRICRIATALAALCLAVCLSVSTPWPAMGDTETLPDADLQRELRAVQDAWAVANYETAAPERDSAFEALAQRADTFVAAFPGRAEPLIWAGIVKSTWAGARGGLGALRLVGESRRLLETAERIDPGALEGSVYTSLGALYAAVPGWPLSFGDSDKARTYLERAVQTNPTGIDPNYFYGSFLADEGEPDLARTHLERALTAAPRPGRELADAGRRKEIQQKLRELPPRPDTAPGQRP
jgi:tetratricopeptide (TPR) repeat protein